MKQRTRLFVIGAAGILVVGLGTGLVASYMGLQNFAIIGANGPSELQFIAPDAQWVAFANVREVMDSQLRQKIRQFHPDAPDGPGRFKDETGIDLETDIDEVIVSGLGATAQLQDDRPLLLARGRFDETRIEGLMREHGGAVDEYKGKRIISITMPNATPANGAPSNVAVAFIEPGFVAVGTAASVRGALDVKDSGHNVTDNAELMKLVHDIDNGNAWAVARFDALSRNQHIPANIASRLPAITWFAASGHVNGGLRGTIRAIARDEIAAQDLREVIRGFMALARLQIGQRTDFADLLDSIQLSGQGTSVALDFALPSQMIDALGALHADRLQNAPATPERQDAPRPRAVPGSPSI
jgi:hypothetical protein